MTQSIYWWEMGWIYFTTLYFQVFPGISRYFQVFHVRITDLKTGNFTSRKFHESVLRPRVSVLQQLDLRVVDLYEMAHSREQALVPTCTDDWSRLFSFYSPTKSVSKNTFISIVGCSPVVVHRVWTKYKVGM